MGLIDTATAPLRYLLRSAESEADAVLPVKDIDRIQTHLLGAVEAVREATDQIEAHVEVIETLAASLTPLTEAMVKLSEEMESLPALTQSVARLTAQLEVVTEVLTPIVRVEEKASKLGHLFSRHRHS